MGIDDLGHWRAPLLHGTLSFRLPLVEFDADEVSAQRTLVGIGASVLAGALPLGLVEQNVFSARRAEFEWGIEHVPARLRLGIDCACAPVITPNRLRKLLRRDTEDSLIRFPRRDDICRLASWSDASLRRREFVNEMDPLPTFGIDQSGIAGTLYGVNSPYC